VDGDAAFSLKNKGAEKTIVFEVTAPDGAAEASLEAVVQVGERSYSNRLVSIKYDHIPQQSVLLPAKTKAARLQLAVTAKKVGYYMGAGDDVPAALQRMGCEVTMLKDEDMTPEYLSRMDAIVLGVRAYNTKAPLALHQSKLFDYVQNGGTLITQYNNNFDWIVESNKVAPYPMKVSRARVTEENAEVRLLLPDHPVLSTPNKISTADFDGWVQERGLYFPDQWDTAFAAPLSMNDTGAKPTDGALLVAPYGKGYFAYTGLSFFRELPAGVPGAYRLFANMLSLKQVATGGR
jgi:hypothetical protein